MIYFTSDLHLFHKSIIKYCNRPFTDVSDMNAQLIWNWNNTVPPGSDVYFLGDLAFCQRHDVVENILTCLNGTKYLIKGNHDKDINKVKDSFAWVKDYYKLRWNNYKIILMHYPLRSWDCMHHGSLMLHGHCHGTLAEDQHSKIMDIGIDATAARLGGGREDYRPVSMDEVLTYMQTKLPFIPVDHHT